MIAAADSEVDLAVEVGLAGGIPLEDAWGLSWRLSADSANVRVAASLKKENVVKEIVEFLEEKNMKKISCGAFFEDNLNRENEK